MKLIEMHEFNEEGFSPYSMTINPFNIYWNDKNKQFMERKNKTFLPIKIMGCLRKYECTKSIDGFEKGKQYYCIHQACDKNWYFNHMKNSDNCFNDILQQEHTYLYFKPIYNF